MKIKRRTREKYQRFLDLGANEVRPLPAERIPLDQHGDAALHCFHMLESTGQLRPCCEPELLEKYLAGKKLHGLTVEMAAEDLFGRVLFNEDVIRDYPDWVANEIFAAARKVALKQIGFVPKFLETQRDFTNPTPEMEKRLEEVAFSWVSGLTHHKV